MKTEARLFIGVALFFTTIGLLYWFTSYEDAGSTMLFFSMGLGAIPGGFLFWWSRRMSPRPEDRDDARVDAGAGPIGAFPESSIWPFVLAVGVTLLALLLVLGLWIGIPGLLLMMYAVIGVTKESRRGGTI